MGKTRLGAVCALLPLLCLLFITHGCSSLSPGAEESAPKSNPPASALTPEPPALGTPSPARETSQQDCLDNDSVGEIRAEYEANPFRAEETFVGERICLKGKIESFHEERSQRGVSLGIEDNWRIRVDKLLPGYGETEELLDYEREWEQWADWLMSSSVGDTVEFECMIDSLWARC